MPVIILAIAALLLAGPAVAQGSTVVVPRTTITVDEQPMVVQPGPFAPGTPTPSPQERRSRTDQVQQAQPAPVTAPTPARSRPQQGPRRPTNGYSSFLTGPIDLTRPPVPQQ